MKIVRKKVYHGKRKRKQKKHRSWGKYLCWMMALFLFFWIGVTIRNIMKPFQIGLDPGHGGEDTGAQGVMREVDLTEQTTAALEQLLKQDGRFRVVLSRKYGVYEEINTRNAVFQKASPNLVLSIHGNADTAGTAQGFECYPSPPGRENYGMSYIFAKHLAKQMEAMGSPLRGIGGIRYGYYIPDESGEYHKSIVEANDTTVYEYGTFGVLEQMKCPAVLVEQCFVTNLNDVEKFGTQEGCQKAAKAYYQAICDYFGIDPR